MSNINEKRNHDVGHDFTKYTPESRDVISRQFVEMRIGRNAFSESKQSYIIFIVLNGCVDYFSAR